MDNAELAELLRRALAMYPGATRFSLADTVSMLRFVAVAAFESAQGQRRPIVTWYITLDNDSPPVKYIKVDGQQYTPDEIVEALQRERLKK